MLVEFNLIKVKIFVGSSCSLRVW